MAVIGFVNHKLAEGLTERSVNSYERLLNKWVEYEGDKGIAEIETADIREYLAWQTGTQLGREPTLEMCKLHESYGRIFLPWANFRNCHLCDSLHDLSSTPNFFVLIDFC